MQSTAILEKSNAGAAANNTRFKGASRISWSSFERKYLQREDKFKYEWVSGKVEKTLKSMNQQQQFIWLNLVNFLNKLQKNDESIGELIPEVDTFFGENHRRPDIAYFSQAQIPLMRQSNQVPSFIVEVISSKDQLIAANEKLADYRNSNVLVVWHVFPSLQEVHVYHNKQMAICIKDDICSAEPAIPGFALLVNEVFA